MDTLFEVLNSYVGRDSIIRTCSYLSLLLSEYTNQSLSRKLRTISSELSYSRLINRFFDDLPMLRYTLQCGIGSKKTDKLLQVLLALQNIADQMYLPVEHFAWAADKKLVKAESNLFYTISTGLWALSSYLNILRCLVSISRLESCKEINGNVVNRNASHQQFEELLFAFKSLADFVVAVNYLPKDSLMWAGKLSTKKTALFGLISSVLRVYLYIRNMNES